MDTEPTREQLVVALEACEWQFAKTMPESPHWYTLRSKWEQPIPFETVAQFIRDHGRRVKFDGRPYTYFTANGFSYWTMGWPLDQTILINRAAIGETT